MGYKRSESEDAYAREELGAALASLSDPSKMLKFLVFANNRIGSDPAKLSLRMAHYVSGSRVPSAGLALLLKNFERGQHGNK